MPTALVEAMPEQPPLRRKRWTRAECAAMEAAGVALDRVELIEGELIDKMGKKRPHVDSLAFLRNWLVSIYGWRYVNTEAPIDVSPEDNPTNEPEPDAIVLRPQFAAFRTATPGPQDLQLVVEVADSSLAFDLGPKAELYARAAILEYWVLDVAGRRLIVHRDPRGGRYRSVMAFAADESAAPLSAPDSRFPVGEALPE